MALATLFESEVPANAETTMPFSELYPLVSNFFAQYCQQKSLMFNSVEREISYKSTKIRFQLNYSSAAKKYFLGFVPKNVWTTAYKKVLIPAFSETLSFYNDLPNAIQTGDLKLVKSKISGFIDISDWSFSTVPPISKTKIREIGNGFPPVKSLSKEILDKKNGVIEKKFLLINAGGIINRPGLATISQILEPFFSAPPEVINYSDTLLETIEKRADKQNLFILFFGDQLSVDANYPRLKLYLISNNIPSQFVNTSKIDTIKNFGAQNLIFEVLKKTLNADTISLDMRGSLGIDGYLCLSDIDSVENNKLFGVSMSFSGQGATQDWLDIYNDIDYVSEESRIEFKQGELTKLANKVVELSGLSGRTIDVFVTKRWAHPLVGYFSNYLDKKGIHVRKFIYISSRSNRFLFSSLMDEDQNLYRHPYIIWDDKTASIQTNSKIQLYGTMFPIYIELLNVWSGQKITCDDLEAILWLVKKRIYRIANFFSLKEPELIRLFEYARKLKLASLNNRLRISPNILI